MTEFEKINAGAKRPTDIWTNYLYYTFSLRLVYLIRNTKITPNMLTLTSLFLVLLGCAGYATGDRTYMVWGLVVAQISYVLDCADGQLARYRKQYSPIGGWLDQTADRIKEYAVYFSLAFGYTRNHPGNTSIWMWAMTALFALYLLEYFGQIKMIRVNPPQAATATSDDAGDEQAAPDTFGHLQRWRSFIPFRSFIIGEQYFTMLIFVAFNWIYSFFVFVTVIGLLMALYRPVIDYIKYRRSVRAL